MIHALLIALTETYATVTNRTVAGRFFYLGRNRRMFYLGGARLLLHIILVAVTVLAMPVGASLAGQWNKSAGYR